jgi:hypothetical protein
MRERDFNKELLFFLEKIKNNEHFSLSRWGDGELMILEKKFIDLRNTKNGEFRYDPNLIQYSKMWNKLMESYTHSFENYFIGIACACCVGQEKFEYMKKLSRQKEENLTWANIFVNSNYNTFIKLYSKEFENHNIIMVVNEKGDTNKLPFKVSKTYTVGTDAWFENYNLVDIIKKDILNNKINNTIFLFAAGPFANILTYELWDYDQSNTYIDIGSVYDVQLGMKATRGYLMGAPTLQKKCIW